MAILKVANIHFDVAGTTLIRANGANTLTINTSGTEDVRFDAAGNVLVGRTNSTIGAGVKLDVSGSINTDSLFATGNIGIGTTTPTQKLEVNGSVKFTSSSANARIYLNNNIEITTNSKKSNVSNTETIITSFSTSNYRGGKFIIIGKRQNDTHMSEMLLIHNNQNAFYNEYGIVYSNVSLYSVSANVFSGNVQIILTSAYDDMNYDIIENKFVHEQTLSFDFINNSYNLLT